MCVGDPVGKDAVGSDVGTREGADVGDIEGETDMRTSRVQSIGLAIAVVKTNTIARADRKAIAAQMQVGIATPAIHDTRDRRPAIDNPRDRRCSLAG